MAKATVHRGAPTGLRHLRWGGVAIVLAALVVGPAVLPAAASAPPSAAVSLGSVVGDGAKKPAAKKALQTFGIGPANVKGLDQRPAFVYEGRPGALIKDRFALVNYTTAPIKVRVYSSDAFTTENGAFDLLAADRTPTEVGAWSSLKPRTLTIPARSKRVGAPPALLTIPFSVRVPKTVTPGDHAGGIVASVQTRPAAQAGANSVVVDRRVGTRIYVRVPGALDPQLTITDVRATYAGTLNPIGSGAVRVTYRVKNTGNVVLSAAQRVRVTGLLGTQAQAPALADLNQLLPGGDVLLATTVTGVLPTIRVSAVVDLAPYAGTTDSKQSFPGVSASASTWAIPWTLVALIIVAIATAYYLNRRRRRTLPDIVSDLSELDDVVMVP